MPRRLRAALPALACVLAACASSARLTPPGPEPAAECVVGMGNAGDSSTAIRVAVTTPVDTAHAPWPRDAGERLLFAQLFEPLVRLDCTGALIPGVARSWNRDSTPTPGVTRWSFVLRRDARFRNGERVHASDVIASWHASAAAHSREPAGSLISAIASNARAADDSTIVVLLPDSLGDVRAFASPRLAIAGPDAGGSSWPDGTTSYYVDSTTKRYGHDPSEALPIVAAIGLRARGTATSLLFQVEPGADHRDILDAGTDVLITSSPAAVQYARTQSSRASIPLPWTRGYALVLPGREGVGDVTDDCIEAGLRPLRDALALAVHVEARGAEGPCWWKPGSDVALSSARPGPHQSARSRRILYQIQDATARELAERIVALAAPGREEPATTALRSAAPELFEGGGWSAGGADSAQFSERLARRDEGGFILALPRDPAWPAAARASLLTAAPWLAPLGRSRAILPLVDTRASLLIRRERGIPRMTILHDGTVIFAVPATASGERRSGESANGKSANGKSANGKSANAGSSP